MGYLEKYMRYLVEECYEEDYDPYMAETWRDNFCHQYSFSEWYFMYRRLWHNPRKQKKYSHTHEKLIIGHEKVEAGFRF